MDKSRKSYPPKFKETARREFISQHISLGQLQNIMAQRHNMVISVEALRGWAKDGEWYSERRKTRSLCPHCKEDISELFSGGKINVAAMFEDLVIRLFDEIIAANQLDPRRISEWRSLVKESGLKDTLGKKSAMSDLDLILRERKKKIDNV